MVSEAWVFSELGLVDLVQLSEDIGLVDGLGPGQAKTCLPSVLLMPKAYGPVRALRYQIGCCIFMGTGHQLGQRWGQETWLSSV